MQTNLDAEVITVGLSTLRDDGGGVLRIVVIVSQFGDYFLKWICMTAFFLCFSSPHTRNWDFSVPLAVGFYVVALTLFIYEIVSCYCSDCGFMMCLMQLIFCCYFYHFSICPEYVI